MIAALRLSILRRRQRHLLKEIEEMNAALEHGYRRLRKLEEAARSVEREINKRELTLGRIACP